MPLKSALVLFLGFALLVAGCGQGSLDSGVSAQGSGQASPQSGAAGSIPSPTVPGATR